MAINIMKKKQQQRNTPKRSTRKVSKSFCGRKKQKAKEAQEKRPRKILKLYQFYRERDKKLSKEQKQKLVEYGRNYHIRHSK